MNETLFQYLWKNRLFKPASLKTTENEPLTIISPGDLNTNSGPDFLEARIKIGDKLWVGNVELHLKSSDWHKHRHDGNPVYQNIILHVVYEDDEPLAGISFPTLEMKNYLDISITERYFYLMSLEQPIACSSQIHKTPEIVWSLWLDSLLAERWEQRLSEWQDIWESSNKDWRTLLYYRLAANFGFHVNRDAFLELALSIPLSVLVKHRKNIRQIEAILFGQSGLLLHSRQDVYMQSLEKEYHFLRRKYQLRPMFAHQWKFMRMRPQNFPTIRIAQFAMLIHKSIELFAQMMEIRNAKELIEILDIHADSYWDNHYRFGEISEDVQAKYLGKDAILNIMINTVAPMQYLYAKLQGRSELIESSVQILQNIKPEKNNIIDEWRDIGITAKDAGQSQALLQLFNQYCTAKKCLNCNVGNRLIRKGSITNEK